VRNSNVEVFEFAMNNPQNLRSPYSSYFVSERSYRSQSLRTKIKSGATDIHSREAVKTSSVLKNQTFSTAKASRSFCPPTSIYSMP
jgi:hypothetical protein